MRKADEFDMAEDAQILGRVRPLLAEVFCGGGCYRGAVLPDVSLPKLYARAAAQFNLNELTFGNLEFFGVAINGTPIGWGWGATPSVPVPP